MGQAEMKERFDVEVKSVVEFISDRLRNSTTSAMPLRNKTYTSELFPWLYLRHRDKGYNVIRYQGIASGDALVIANIEAAEEIQGNGLFTALVTELLTGEIGYDVIEIELVHNQRLVQKLLRMGFQQLGNQPDLASNYFKRTSRSVSQ